MYRAEQIVVLGIATHNTKNAGSFASVKGLGQVKDKSPWEIRHNSQRQSGLGMVENTLAQSTIPIVIPENIFDEHTVVDVVRPSLVSG